VINRNSPKQPSEKHGRWGEFLVIVILLVTLAGGAYFRLVGVNWDENQHMHPDERFLSMVQAAISPVENLSEYFDTARSSLNPANKGYSFFVYGTLPIFIVQYVGEALGQADYHSIAIVGRHLSAIFDTITVLLVFAIGRRLYNKWVGLLGAVFYALAVLPIQLSHYATVDTFTNTFAILAVYAAVWALTRPTTPEPVEYDQNLQDNPNQLEQRDGIEVGSDSQHSQLKKGLIDLVPYVLFGIALGAATASKINAVVIALILPMVEAMRYLGMKNEQRREAILPILRNLVVGGLLSFLVFRIAQPYAFDGPGFFNISINQNWWNGLQSLRAQSSGTVDFPPALQWARRPITFSWENMVAWGLGWPLGLTAWLSFIGMGVMIFAKKDWRRHFPLWAFTGGHFLWQSIAWTRSMRYQMLIYPLLALIAGWGLVKLWSVRRTIKVFQVKIQPKTIRIVGILLTLVIVLTTAAWAFAFTRIYTRPHTRAAASRWIYQNIPGALTLHLETPDGDFQQPLPFSAGDTLSLGQPYTQPFFGVANGLLTEIKFPHILDQSQTGELTQITLSIISAQDSRQVLSSAWVESAFLPVDNDWRGAAYEFVLDPPLRVTEGELYYLQLLLHHDYQELLLNGSPSLAYLTNDGMALTSPLPNVQRSIRVDQPFAMNIRIVESGRITAMGLPFLVDQAGVPGEKELILELQLPDQGGISRSTSIRGMFAPGDDVRGEPAEFVLADPLVVAAGQNLFISLRTDHEGAQLVPHPLAPVLETSWDDAIPYPLDGFSPYSEGGGIYRAGLNFEMYWPDDQNKLQRFETNLDLADYIFMSSNRQWGTTTRVPERYLLTTFYYRNLLGCPIGEDVEWCYRVAEPGMFQGTLGFDLVATFQSYPNLGPIEFNTQFAEEAFTVYDHPKVMIFRKAADYDPIEVRTLLRSVDLSKVVYFTPGDAASYRGPDPEQFYEPRHNLMLPENRLEQQRQGGTWSELFNRQSLINTSQIFAAVIFYLFALFLGLICYPLLRLALPGLADRGYPFAKLAGLLLLAFFVWILGSFGVAVTPQTIFFVLIGLILVCGILFYIQRKLLWQEIKTNWRYFLMVEALGLIAFLLFLWVRTGNPDLWHPFKGGEKPMDFSYLNAVIKSTTFPPYDPWFAGGYINYYYYGFVIVGMPIKLLGIIPAVAYNLVLPLWYSLLILGAFSVGWNLYKGIQRPRDLHVGEHDSGRLFGMAFWVGLATAILMAVLGNLGTIRLINTGFQRIAAGGMPIDEASLGQQISWTLQGMAQFLQGTPLPFYPGDWYWVPSRVIPGEPITEFPYFTFIYADLHAHLIAFPMTVLAISWSLSVVLSKACWREKDGKFNWLGMIVSFFFGAMVIGALRPTNTWDFFTYLVLASIVLFYTILKNYQPRIKYKFSKSNWVEMIGVALTAVFALVLLSFLLYQPFAYWFGQGYTRVDIWEGDRTPLDSYFTHWGLFLFIIVSWMSWETYHWMKTTPASHLVKLKPYLNWVYAILVLFIIIMFLFLLMGVPVGLIVLPIGLWVVVLMLRPDRTDSGRFHLFLIGTAVTLTLVVELVFLPGDIGRMNTVFKFYLQAWIMFASAAGVCFGWLLQSLRYWRVRLVFFWQGLLFLLVAGAALFTLLGTADKIRDRMVPNAPQTLDGMAYMAFATYYDMGLDMQLVEDYYGIQWMQDHIKGSPVILEGQAYEYRWGNRYSIYTGLPGVVGWNWHQRQQRAVLRSSVVQERVNAVDTFYTTEDMSFVIDFINTHDVSYIVVGQLEQAFYPGPGLEKFRAYEGQLWDVVFRVGSTVIYEVRN
jgi:YYY domain-containing protein